ncbi:MAG TPA: FecR domain-containing protein [Rhizomicrobium sp.]|nr:FecR domain-containing protein [Rhizomicrobium sp.]
MSNAGLESSPAGGAAEIEADAAAWVRRRHFWDWSEQDQASLEAWLNESLAHEVAYLRLEAAWNRTERLAALHPFKHEQPDVERRNWRVPLAIAAGFAAIAFASAAALPLLHRPMETIYSTPVGGREIITLADGSKIELNTASVLHLAPDQREALLDKGEAYFQIKHDAAHPFALRVAGRSVVDLGTKFFVRNGQNQVEVALVEGRARLESAAVAPSRAIVLTPGDVAVASADTTSVTKMSAHDLANELSWRRGLLIFHNASLASAAAVINRYNDNKLVVDDPAIAKLTINGTFRTNDNQVFARMAQDVFGLRVTYRANTTRISR